MSQSWSNEVRSKRIKIHSQFIKNLFNFSRPVSIIRFIAQDTIEEGIYEMAQSKLNLEQQITHTEGMCIMISDWCYNMKDR